MKERINIIDRNYSQKHASKPHVCTDTVLSPSSYSPLFVLWNSWCQEQNCPRLIRVRCYPVYIGTPLTISIYTFSANTIDNFKYRHRSLAIISVFLSTDRDQHWSSSRTQRDWSVQLFTGWAVSPGRDLCTVSWRDLVDEARNKWTNERASWRGERTKTDGEKERSSESARVYGGKVDRHRGERQRGKEKERKREKEREKMKKGYYK